MEDNKVKSEEQPSVGTPVDGTSVSCYDHATIEEHRAIAQLASALAWGARGRGFKSL